MLDSVGHQKRENPQQFVFVLRASYDSHRNEKIPFLHHHPHPPAYQLPPSIRHPLRSLDRRGEKLTRKWMFSWEDEMEEYCFLTREGRGLLIIRFISHFLATCARSSRFIHETIVNKSNSFTFIGNYWQRRSFDSSTFRMTGYSEPLALRSFRIRIVQLR